MNCRPGDLAVIVGKQGLGEDHFEGQIRRVIKLSARGGTCWEYEGERLVSRVFGVCFALADASLRPIRPQDDDAQDESLRYLPPVPQLEHA